MIHINCSLRRVDDSIEHYAEFASMAEELDDYDAVKRACNETGYLYCIIVSGKRCTVGSGLGCNEVHAPRGNTSLLFGFHYFVLCNEVFFR
jgi:hypothetical protein